MWNLFQVWDLYKISLTNIPVGSSTTSRLTSVISLLNSISDSMQRAIRESPVRTPSGQPTCKHQDRFDRTRVTSDELQPARRRPLKTAEFSRAHDSRSRPYEHERHARWMVSKLRYCSCGLQQSQLVTHDVVVQQWPLKPHFHFPCCSAGGSCGCAASLSFSLHLPSRFCFPCVAMLLHPSLSSINI